ncbi:unnamed protein product [Mytilus edulis]|uniref:Uncharacterized protein n=1 Tax=Mytilus edulis TaxID=6550 RepID=A0A8S3U6M9_MYTED|nr:unnamed protein product [Mytilus edulis]
MPNFGSSLDVKHCLFWNLVSTTACTTDYDCEQIHVHMYGYECDRSVGYCRCQERYFEVGDICQQRGDNGNPCNSSIANSCFHPGELICNSGNICSCSDTNTHYWKASTFSCTPRGNNRGDCDNNIDHSCLYLGQLICTSGNTCECFDEFSNYWKASTSTCTPKGHNGGDCTSGITDSCIYSEQLVCKSDNKCSCPDTSTHYWNDYSCTPRGNNGEYCTSGIADSCLHTGELVCKSDNKCSCSDTNTHYWHASAMTCSLTIELCHCKFFLGSHKFCASEPSPENVQPSHG